MRWGFALCLMVLAWAACEPERARCRVVRGGAQQEIVLVQGECAGQDFGGVDLSAADVSGAVWGDNAVCPDGTLSGQHGGTCEGHLSPSTANNADNTNNTNNNANNLNHENNSNNLNNTNNNPNNLNNNPNNLNNNNNTNNLNNVNNSDPGDVQEEPDADEDVAQDADADSPDAECEPNECGGCGPLSVPLGPSCDPCLTGVGRCNGVGDSYCYRGESTQQCGAACAVHEDCDSRFCSNGRCSVFGLAWISPGRFAMGSPEDEFGRFDDEVLHEVTLTRPFFAMQYEIGQGIWEMIFPSAPAACVECAVGNASWFQAIIFANRLSANSNLEPCYTNPLGEPFDVADLGIQTPTPRWSKGLDCLGWRLPTEAEWEYMARAGTSTPWHCGSSENCLPEVAWYEDHVEASDGLLNRPGQLVPNDWGIYDAHGNAWEWVWDGYEPTLGAARDPIIGEREAGRVLRGGGVNDDALNTRSAFRNVTRPSTFSNDFGVRLVRTIRPVE